MLAGSHVFPTFRRKDPILLIMPITNINNIYHSSPFRVCKNSILHILCRTQCYFSFLSGFSFPLGYDIQPELYEVQWPCKFCTCQLNDIRIICEVIETLANILPMQLAAYRMTDIVKHICYENTFVSGKWNGFRKSGLIDIITASPRTVHPMCSGFQNIMLEVVFVE